MIRKRLRHYYYKYILTNKLFIQKYYKKHTGKKLNLKNPIEFSEKIQWLKLYWYNPIAEKCADKYEVRKIVKEKVGAEVLNDLYGVYDSIEEIDIEKLPNSFVLKATHSSGHNFICKDKNKVNWDKKLKELEHWYRINYFWSTREWVYKDIQPRIISEKYLSDDNDGETLTDYKIYCFHGEPHYCQVIKGRENGGSIDFYDTSWNHMNFSGLQKMPQSKKVIKKPEKFNQMLEISKILSKDFPFVRVDFYYVQNKIYFGELTFFPKSGFGNFYPQEWNKKMGDLLTLPSMGKKNKAI